MRADERVVVLGALRALPTLASLPDDVLRAVADITELCELPIGDVLASAGGIGRQSFVVISGTAGVHVGADVVARLGAGSVVGELEPAKYRPLAATIVAEQPMLLLVLGPAPLSIIAAARAAVAPAAT